MKFGRDAADMKAPMGWQRQIVLLFLACLQFGPSTARLVQPTQGHLRLSFLGVRDEYKRTSETKRKDHADEQLIANSQAANSSTADLTGANLSAAVNQTPAVQEAQQDYDSAVASHSAGQAQVEQSQQALQEAAALVNETQQALRTARSQATAILDGSAPNTTAASSSNASNSSNGTGNVSYATRTNATDSGSIWPVEQPDPASGYGQLTTTTLPVPRCPETRTVYVDSPCNGTNATSSNLPVSGQPGGNLTSQNMSISSTMNASNATDTITLPNGTVINVTGGSSAPGAATNPMGPMGDLAQAAGVTMLTTTTTTTTTNQFQVLSAHASAAAANALAAAARAAAGEPSEEAIQAQAAAARAVQIAENSKSISAQAYAVASGMRGSVQTLRTDLAAAASARAAELENVRVGRPTLPSSPTAPSSMEPKGSQMAMAT